MDGCPFDKITIKRSLNPIRALASTQKRPAQQCSQTHSRETPLAEKKKDFSFFFFFHYLIPPLSTETQAGCEV